MGRRKIVIKQIPDVKLRHITFNKRKNGLFKKAAELSMLCNLNLLLVCEDGLGNLIQFSKNKINDVNHFLKQCNYTNIVDLTADDYPDFSRINKKKDKDAIDSDSDGNDDYIPNEKDFAPAPVETKGRNARKLPMDELNNYGEPPEKALKNKKNQIAPPQVDDDANGNDLDAQNKKNKNRLKLRLNIPKGAENPEAQAQANEGQIKLPVVSNNDQPSAFAFNALRQKNEFIQQPPRSIDKAMDFTPNSFMPFMGGMKGLDSIYNASMTSPFKFYAAQQHSLNSVLKGLSPFTFPLPSANLVSKGPLTENEEKMMGYMNSRAQLNQEAGSAHSHKVFTFQPEENMPAMPNVNQLQNAQQLALLNQRGLSNAGQIPEYVNLPSNMKSEADFEGINLPPDTLSARRFNFGGYMFDDATYNDLAKKYKMT